MTVVIIAPEPSLLDTFFRFYRPAAPSGRIVVADVEPAASWGDAICFRDMAGLAQVTATVSTLIFVGAPSIALVKQALFYAASGGVGAAFVFDGMTLAPLADFLARRRPRRRRRVCIIFPGRLLPVRNGAAARTLDLLISAAALHQVLLVVPASSFRPKTLRSLFTVLGITVWTNSVARLDETFAKRAGRLVNWLRGREGFTPIWARAAACRLSQRTAAAINAWKPEIVLFTYAWTIDRRIRAPLRVLDAIDVLSTRARSMGAASAAERLLLRREEADERRRLGMVDRVLAISRKDRESFLEMGAARRLALVYPSFSWIARRPQTSAGTMRLGFFGGEMAANVEAARQAVDRLQRIGFFADGGVLVVAGDVCKRLGSTPAGVIQVGWLADPGWFYDVVDVIYAPITVAGGINFKIFEALAADRPVITNALGAAEFAFRKPQSALHVADDDESLSAALRELGAGGAPGVAAPAELPQAAAQ